VILADTSAWIEVYRGTGSSVHLAMRRLLLERSDLCVTETVVMEMLASARPREHLAAVRRRLLSFPMLQVGGLETFERAAMIQRACRAGGETVRSLTDCLTAAVAIRDGATLLHADRDFDTIARHTSLRLEPTG
jgi:predicted nucleic acid-binding protein